MYKNHYGRLSKYDCLYQLSSMRDWNYLTSQVKSFLLTIYLYQEALCLKHLHLKVTLSSIRDCCSCFSELEEAFHVQEPLVFGVRVAVIQSI